MKVALVGNNDGPLIMANAMLAINKIPVCIGLQKPVPGILKAAYVGLVGEQRCFSDFDESRLLDVLQAFDFDVLINCFCNFKFKKLLERYTVLNVHLAPLPKYRGRHPLHWALINGEKEFGFTVHKMDADFDSGEIYWQEKVPIEPGMSVEELREALMKKLALGFGDFLEIYEKGKISPLSNSNTEATYAPKRNPEDSLLTEWHDRDTIYRKVMALRSGNHPAYLKVDRQKIIVTLAEIEEVETDFQESNDLVSDHRKSGLDQNGTHNGRGSDVQIHRLHENGISFICKDKKRIGLYGFNPKEFKLSKNQNLI